MVPNAALPGDRQPAVLRLLFPGRSLRTFGGQDGVTELSGMRSSLLCVLVLSLFGCWGRTSDRPVAHRPTSTVAQPLPGTARSPAAPGQMAPAGGAARECEAIAATLRGVPEAEVTRSDGTFDDQVGGRDRAGCRVAVKGAFGALRGAQRPEIRLAEALQGRGLTYDHRYDADGPDGTSFALRTDATLCIVHVKWDGGDDSDPNYVPGDWYELLAGCTPEPASGKP